MEVVGLDLACPIEHKDALALICNTDCGVDLQGRNGHQSLASSLDGANSANRPALNIPIVQWVVGTTSAELFAISIVYRKVGVEHTLRCSTHERPKQSGGS